MRLVRLGSSANAVRALTRMAGNSVASASRPRVHSTRHPFRLAVRRGEFPIQGGRHLERQQGPPDTIQWLKLRFRSLHASASTPSSSSTCGTQQVEPTPGMGWIRIARAHHHPANAGVEMAVVHAPVRPWVLQGSSVTYRVASGAGLRPSARRACTSACPCPAAGCQPSATTSPASTISAPTIGFGWVWPQALPASSSARAIQR